MQVSDPLAQREPVLLAARIALLWAKHLEPRGIVDGGLGPQDAALLVVELDRIFADPVFDPNSLGPVLELADHLTLEVAVEPAAEKAHHIRTGEAGDGVMDQARVDAAQCDRALEGD